MRLPIIAVLLAFWAHCAHAQWVVLSPSDSRTSLPAKTPGDAHPIAPGDKWTDDNHFRWLIGDLKIPEQIEGKPAAGKVVGLRINCGDGGEIWVGKRLETRYDNDHPGLVVVADKAVPG